MKKLTATKAIRAKCIQCCYGSPKEVKLCTAKDCALYHFRFGHAPKEPVDATTIYAFADGTGQIFSERPKKNGSDEIDEQDLIEHRIFPNPWEDDEEE